MQGPWNNSESGAARSYKLANKRRPHNSASCNGYKWRLCAPLIPSGIIARPSPSIHVLLELNEETERGRETIVAGMKRTLGNTGVTIDRFERRIDRKFSPVPKHPLFRLDLGHIWSVHEFFPIVVRTCEKPCSPPPRIVMRSSKKNSRWKRKYIHIKTCDF